MRVPFVLFLLLGEALGCSYVEVPVPDPSAANGTKFVIGRTNELGNIFGVTHYRAAVHPRGERGAKYGYLSLEGTMSSWKGQPWVAIDGMNEAGLTIGAQTLQESHYQSPTIDFDRDVLHLNLVAELLKCCSGVDEALGWLAEHRVVGPSGGLGLHWAVTDASGRSVVVEYLRGERIVWENTPRVMTNDPPLDWHWRNLNTFTNLNSAFPHQNDFLGVETDVGTVPKAVGHGWNLFGLPGDTSPPSRFAQLFYLRGYALKASPPRDVEDAIVLATALLNRVFIPLGTVGMDGGVEIIEGPEYTPFGIVKIPSERRLLYRGYRNLRWRQIDLRKLDFNQSVEWPVEDGSLGIEDITSSGRPAERTLEFAV